MTDTSNLALPLLAAAQSQKHVTHNEALIRLDALVQIAVLAVGQNTPPISPNSGDRYLVGTQPTGAFANQAGLLASYDGSIWRFLQAKPGWLLFNITDSSVQVFDGTAWQRVNTIPTSLQNAPGFGLGTSSDSYNLFSAKLNSALFAAKGTSEGGSGDVRVTLNKQASGNTASQLYQTNWSGRAETGLSGDDNWHVKVSGDGSTWVEALNVNAATGAVRVDQILSGRATVANTGKFESDFDGSSSNGIVLSDISATSTATALLFRKGGAVVGGVKLTATGTNFLTTSDYRLKRDIRPIEGALDQVIELNPVRFAFKDSPHQRVDGFLAHEVAYVVPEAVSGEKDAVDKDGNIVPQTLDQSRLIPMLVAAMQELLVRVEELEEFL